jgi:hypothetical protein
MEPVNPGVTSQKRPFSAIGSMEKQNVTEHKTDIGTKKHKADGGQNVGNHIHEQLTPNQPLPPGQKPSSNGPLATQFQNLNPNMPNTGMFQAFSKKSEGMQVYAVEKGAEANYSNDVVGNFVVLRDTAYKQEYGNMKLMVQTIPLYTPLFMQGIVAADHTRLTEHVRTWGEVNRLFYNLSAECDIDETSAHRAWKMMGLRSELHEGQDPAKNSKHQLSLVYNLSGPDIVANLWGNCGQQVREGSYLYGLLVRRTCDFEDQELDYIERFCPIQDSRYHDYIRKPLQAKYASITPASLAMNGKSLLTNVNGVVSTNITARDPHGIIFRNPLRTYWCIVPYVMNGNGPPTMRSYNTAQWRGKAMLFGQVKRVIKLEDDISRYSTQIEECIHVRNNNQNRYLQNLIRIPRLEVDLMIEC